MDDPRDEAELIKMREQHRDFLSEKFLLANKIYAEQSHAHRMNAIANVKEYGTLTIRSLFILHGGAMVALLGFIGALFAKGEERSILIASAMARSLRPAFYCFSSGIVLIGVVAAIAYVNWSAVFESYQSPKHLSDLIALGKSELIDPKYSNIATFTTKIAVLVGVISLLMFVIGIFIVANSLDIAGI